MDILECGNWVGCLAQIPHIEAWVLVIVISDHELCRLLRVPHHASFLHSISALLLAGIAEIGLRGVSLRLSELEN